jgi:predicted enzyme related to lactoylglutathione lyase
VSPDLDSPSQRFFGRFLATGLRAGRYSVAAILREIRRDVLPGNFAAGREFGENRSVPASPNRLVAVVLEVSDLPRSVALYRDGFGLDLHLEDHEGDDRWTSGAHAATSWTEGAFLHLALYASKDGTVTSGAQIAFEVADLDAAHRRATAAGAHVVHEPKSQPWGKSARYRDLDGNVIELTQRK